MNNWITTYTQDPQGNLNTASQYQPIAICETYQTDSAELLAPATTTEDEMAIDQLYQSL